jgi:hypothetical protein
MARHLLEGLRTARLPRFRGSWTNPNWQKAKRGAINMGSNCAIGFGGASWSSLSSAVLPLGGGANLAARASAALLRARQLLELVKGKRRQHPVGSGGPETPPQDNPECSSIWDDPALWLLMMH